MQLATKLSLKMTQKLVMTPQLQQAIRLLQLSRLDLLQAIRQEMVENPVLEEETVEEDGGEDAALADYTRSGNKLYKHLVSQHPAL